ncbi:lipoyltransferase [Coniophora puteana RWD-64-598 SS2]|uniref:Octanoyltransferase n=1 Tax=Coniophora puteana (strain RWD-64-598) TaxID=741705 RepID=A0A5M3N5M1_CONPW|nr:lipoyltransferase [Coniophora puteana RWD-64-598 SS2]EIW86364.1 lipoyltransferase [Coniophora puteana RWD-64-598 SS2]
MSLPPVLYHYFEHALPYARTLALQEKLYQIQLASRRTGSHSDILLLLQHRPVYTAGRRQTEDEVSDERSRLTTIGADFVTTGRGGQLTYHGPGQLVGYPLLDLARTKPPLGIRDYICKIQRTIQLHLRSAHGIQHVPSDNTGVFLSPTAKIASIGVQVRHRLTTHGFALNVTPEPRAWFDETVACGLADVRAACIADAAGKNVTVPDVVPDIVEVFGRTFDRDMEKLRLQSAGEIGEAIAGLEEEARAAGDCLPKPLL